MPLSLGSLPINGVTISLRVTLPLSLAVTLLSVGSLYIIEGHSALISGVTPHQWGHSAPYQLGLMPLSVGSLLTGYTVSAYS